MLTAEELDLRRTDIESAPELAALLERLVERAAPVIERMPVVPETQGAANRRWRHLPG